jgi:hypothetical protein
MMSKGKKKPIQLMPMQIGIHFPQLPCLCNLENYPNFFKYTELEKENDIKN